MSSEYDCPNHPSWTTFHRITGTCNEFVNYSFLGFLIFEIGFFPYLIYKSVKKERAIRHEINNKTYSIISIWILRMTIANLVLTMAFNLGVIFDIKYDWGGHAMVSPHMLCVIFGSYISFTQAYEWLSMYSIINYQSDKDFGEILFQI